MLDPPKFDPNPPPNAAPKNPPMPPVISLAILLPMPFAIFPTILFPIPGPVRPFKLFAISTVALVTSCTDPLILSAILSTEIFAL